MRMRQRLGVVMAGSYDHVTDDQGKLLIPEHLHQMVENGGDVYETIEEMYGMIWWLADQNTLGPERMRGGVVWSAAEWVERARQKYLYGIQISPGVDGELGE